MFHVHLSFLVDFVFRFLFLSSLEKVTEKNGSKSLLWLCYEEHWWGSRRLNLKFPAWELEFRVKPSEILGNFKIYTRQNEVFVLLWVLISKMLANFANFRSIFRFYLLPNHQHVRNNFLWNQQSFARRKSSFSEQEMNRIQCIKCFIVSLNQHLFT